MGSIFGSKTGLTSTTYSTPSAPPARLGLALIVSDGTTVVPAASLYIDGATVSDGGDGVAVIDFYTLLDSIVTADGAVVTADGDVVYVVR